MGKIVLHIDNIKSFAKQIEDASSTKLKHSEVLTSISKSFGFPNYQTLKGISDKNDGYIDLPISDFKNTLIFERFQLLDIIKNKLLQEVEPIDTESNEYNFLLMRNKLLEIVIDSLKYFSFIDFKPLQYNLVIEYMSYESLMYYFYLAKKLKKHELEEKINTLFIIKENGNNFTLFDNDKEPIMDFREFKNKYAVSLNELYLKTLHAYACQQWVSKTNRFKEVLKEQIKRGEGVLIIDPKFEEQRIKQGTLKRFLSSFDNGNNIFINKNKNKSFKDELKLNLKKGLIIASGTVAHYKNIKSDLIKNNVIRESAIIIDGRTEEDFKQALTKSKDSLIVIEIHSASIKFVIERILAKKDISIEDLKANLKLIIHSSEKEYEEIYFK